MIMDMQRADEFTKNFYSGTKSGRSVGLMAGQKYLRVTGGIE